MNLALTHRAGLDPIVAGDPFTENPLIPAYRTRRDDRRYSIVFRCPFCKAVHSHGLPPGGGLIQSRASHCHDEMSPLYGLNYRLTIVGEIRWGHTPPKLSADDIRSLNAMVQTK